MTNSTAPLLPLSPKARVGTIIHRLLADAGKGNLYPLATVAAEKRWLSLVAEAEHTMGSSTLERHLVPLQRSVPDLEVRRLRTIRRAIEVASGSSALADKTETYRSTGYGFEVPVRSNDGLVNGIVDAVLPTDSGPLLQDYKSGAVFESSTSEVPRLKEDYEIQLMMYSALYAQTFGVWPTRLEVVRLTGETYEVPFVQQTCLDLLDDARLLLKKYNTLICVASNEQLPHELARPSPSVCWYCLFRPRCGPYLSLQKAEQQGWPIDVVGCFDRVTELRNSRLILRVHNPHGTVSIPGLSSGGRHPILGSLRLGEQIGVFGLGRSGPNSPYFESSLTTICRIVGWPDNN